MLRNGTCLAVCLLLTTSAAVRADEPADLRERVEQLEATVEELTLQLADALKERRRLEAELAEAVAAAGAAVAAPAPATSTASSGLSTGGPPAHENSAIEETAVLPAAAAAASAAAQGSAKAPAAGTTAASSACDVTAALAGYDGKRKGNEALAAWLESDDHLANCSTEQLQAIRDAVKWDWLGYEKPVLKLLDTELARRPDAR